MFSCETIGGLLFKRKNCSEKEMKENVWFSLKYWFNVMYVPTSRNGNVFWEKEKSMFFCLWSSMVIFLKKVKVVCDLGQGEVSDYGFRVEGKLVSRMFEVDFYEMLCS